MAPTLQSRPFKATDNRQKVPIDDPSFRYKPDVVCKFCLELLKLCHDLETATSQLVPQSFHTTFNYGDVVSSAKRGCHMCSLFCAGMQIDPTEDHTGTEKDTGAENATEAEKDMETEVTSLKSLKAIYELLPITTKSSLFSLRLRLEKENQSVARWSDLLYVYRKEDDEVLKWEKTPNWFSEASLGRSTGDHRTTKLAKSWLDHCSKEHKGCCDVSDKKTRAKLPKRLLDLQGGVKLVDYVETEDKRYVTLSHCWGKKHLIRLLKGNMDQFRKGGIANYSGENVKGLPKTFLEAIKVTQALGYRYIWIDSLCIIQDDDDDWKEQAETMAHVYANSAFTIAALKSYGSPQGCFTEGRNPLGRRALHLPDLEISVIPGNPRSLWELEVGRVGHDASPLHTRTWVVQERYFSPRTLLYGKNGIYWECRCAQASESHYRKVDLKGEENKKTWADRLVEFGTGNAHGNKRESWMTHWKGLLKAYSSCDLTKDTDKIKAMAGLISMIEERCKERSNDTRRCILGLWDHDLPRMALWSRSENGGLSGRLQNNIPTWSWASTKGTISYMIPSGRLVRSAEMSFDDDSSEPRTMVVKSRLRQVLQHENINQDDDTPDNYHALKLNPDNPKIENQRKLRKIENMEPYTWFPDCNKPEATADLYIVEIQEYIIDQQYINDLERERLSKNPSEKPNVEQSHKQSEARISWCLVVTPKLASGKGGSENGGSVNDTADKYMRVGICLVRFERIEDGPFWPTGQWEKPEKEKPKEKRPKGKTSERNRSEGERLEAKRPEDLLKTIEIS